MAHPLLTGDPRQGGSVVLVERCVFPGQRGTFQATHTITAMSWPYNCPRR
ncbi:hypothetical protein AB0K48_13960 [Nonomuraea sp. NPDC055795]